MPTFTPQTWPRSIRPTSDYLPRCEEDGNYAGARARENEDDTYVGRPDGGSGSERSI